jgi:hypothetical protein
VAGLPHNNNTPVPIQQKKVPMQTKPPDVTLTNHITEISNGHTALTFADLWISQIWEVPLIYFYQLSLLSSVQHLFPGNSVDLFLVCYDLMVYEQRKSP